MISDSWCLPINSFFKIDYVFSEVLENWAMKYLYHLRLIFGLDIFCFKTFIIMQCFICISIPFFLLLFTRQNEASFIIIYYFFLNTFKLLSRTMVITAIEKNIAWKLLNIKNIFIKNTRRYQWSNYIALIWSFIS